MRVVIVDDEPLARSHLELMVRDHSDLDLVGTVADGEGAIELLRSGPVDLVFLDIRMPGVDGLEVARLALEQGTMVVFTTAFEAHAIEAFDLGAVDYLLKPFDEDRFERAVSRARGKREELGTTTIDAIREIIDREKPVPDRPARFMVKDDERERMVFVAPEEIEWIEACGNYVKLHTSKGRFYLRVTMKSLEEDLLPPNQFLRIRRSALVRLDAVRELHRASHGDFLIILQSGEELVLSRHYRDRLAELTGR